MKLKAITRIVCYHTLFLLLIGCVGEDLVESENLFSESLIIENASDSPADTLWVGDTLHLSAKYTNSQAVEEQVDLIWESANPEFATVDKVGRVIALSKGITIIRVSYQGLMAERLLVVERLERVEISSNKNALQVNETVQLSAKYFDRNGVEQTAGFNWSSSDLSVANISPGGELMGLKEGQVSVTATANGVTSTSFLITVVSDTITAATVEISAPTNSIRVGDELQFTAVVKNINGNVLPNATVNWNSTHSTVLSIDASGVTKGLNVGSSDVSATSGNAGSSSFSVLVNQMMTTSRNGTFQGRGSYTVNGSVVMETTPNGNLRLNFTNFSSSSGPGLYIYLSNSITGGISIEALNNRTGNFSVDLPANIGISHYNYVLIWCKPFGLTFGSALLN